MHVAMLGGRVVKSGAGCYVPDPGAAASNTSPIGINFSLGGTSYLSGEGLPIFQDQFRSGQWVGTPTLDANGWPTADFGFAITVVRQSFAWLTTGGNGKFSCGFTSKNGGAETITGSNCTITDTGTSGGVHTFDLAVTLPITTNPTFNVAGSTGGVTNIFAYLPAYRGSAYSATSLFTTEATNHYANYPYIRGMFWSNAWYNAGKQLTFTGTLAIGATSGTLTAAYTNGTYQGMFVHGTDVRSITISGTAVTWVSALTATATYVTIPNSSATRHTPTNTKCANFWTASGWSFEAYPLDWFVDFCVACNTAPYICMPVNDDGTYQSDAAAMVASKLSGTGLKSYWEVGNECWNGGTFNGASGTLIALAATNGLSVQAQFATLYHTLAATLRTAFGTPTFNSSVNLIVAWQAGQIAQFITFLNYYTAQAWTISSDLKYLANAPYFNTTSIGFTASIANTGVMTVTVSNYHVIGIGGTVTGTGVPASSIINSQLTGDPGGTGTYQLSKSGSTVASESMNVTLALSSSIAQIQSHLTGMCQRFVNYYMVENVAVLALANGLKMATYEGGWQTNSESGSLTNAGASIMDTGMTAVMNTYYNKVFDSGVSLFTQFESGIWGAAISNLAPEDRLSTVYPLTVASCPRFASIVNYATGLPTPTRNVVSGVSSIINGANFADNTGTNLGNFSTGGLAPYQSTGYMPYLINCTMAGNYNLDVTFSGVAGGPTTDVEVNGTKIATSVAVSNGIVRVASASLVAGVNYLCLGRAASQTATINQIQFN